MKSFIIKLFTSTITLWIVILGLIGYVVYLEDRVSSLEWSDDYRLDSHLEIYLASKDSFPHSFDTISESWAGRMVKVTDIKDGKYTVTVELLNTTVFTRTLKDIVMVSMGSRVSYKDKNNIRTVVPINKEVKSGSSIFVKVPLTYDYDKAYTWKLDIYSDSFYIRRD